MAESQDAGTPDVDAEIRQARAARSKTTREKNQTVARREQELVPLWDRIKARTLVNGFGDDYEISLTPKNRKTA